MVPKPCWLRPPKTDIILDSNSQSCQCFRIYFQNLIILPSASRAGPSTPSQHLESVLCNGSPQWARHQSSDQDCRFSPQYCGTFLKRCLTHQSPVSQRGLVDCEATLSCVHLLLSVPSFTKSLESHDREPSMFWGKDGKDSTESRACSGAGRWR